MQHLFGRLGNYWGKHCRRFQDVCLSGKVVQRFFPCLRPRVRSAKFWCPEWMGYGIFCNMHVEWRWPSVFSWWSPWFDVLRFLKISSKSEVQSFNSKTTIHEPHRASRVLRVLALIHIRPSGSWQPENSCRISMLRNMSHEPPDVMIFWYSMFHRHWLNNAWTCDSIVLIAEPSEFEAHKSALHQSKSNSPSHDLSSNVTPVAIPKIKLG